MIDTDNYIEDVEEKYNLIMNLMDDEEREFEIKTRIRQSNRMIEAFSQLQRERTKAEDKLRDIGYVLEYYNSKVWPSADCIEEIMEIWKRD